MQTFRVKVLLITTIYLSIVIATYLLLPVGYGKRRALFEGTMGVGLSAGLLRVLNEKWLSTSQVPVSADAFRCPSRKAYKTRDMQNKGEKWICEQRRSSCPLGCEYRDGCGERWNHLIQRAPSFAWCIISKALPCKCFIMLIWETLERLSGVNLYIPCQPMLGPKSLSIRWHFQYTDCNLEMWKVPYALRPELVQHIAQHQP